MNRRTYLSALGTGAAAVAAGCLDGAGGPADARADTPSEGASTPTQSGTASETAGVPGTSTGTPPPVDVETPAPGECEAPERPRPETHEGLPDPREYPDPPGGFDTGTLRSYLEAYENAYRYNARLVDLVEDDACMEYFETYVTDTAVWETDRGVVGDVVTTGSYTGEVCPGETATGTDTRTPPPHADFFEQSARYLVTERFLVRDETVVECWG